MIGTRRCFMCGQRGLKSRERVFVRCYTDGVKRQVCLCLWCAELCDPEMIFGKLHDLVSSSNITVEGVDYPRYGRDCS